MRLAKCTLICSTHQAMKSSTISRWWPTKWIVLLPCAGLAIAETPTDTPQGYPPDRYESLWKHSPFTLSSVAMEASSLAMDKLALVGVGKVGTGEFVAVIDRQSQERFTITPKANQQGYRLVTLRLNEDPLKVIATVTRGSETFAVRFDPASVKAVTSNQPISRTNISGGPVAPPSRPPGSQ